MGHVRGNNRCGLITTVFIFEADHQGAPLHHEGYIGGIPDAVLEKQIFTFFKAKQRNGVHIPRLNIFEEQQRIAALQSPEFVGIHRHKHHVVAIVGAKLPNDPELGVLHVVKLLNRRHKLGRRVRASRNRDAVGPIITCDCSVGVGSCAGPAAARLERVAGFGCAAGLGVYGEAAIDGF